MFVGSLSGCAPYDPSDLQRGAVQTDAAVPVESSADPIVLQWDPPASEAAYYLISYRTHGASTWLLLGRIVVTAEPEFPIPHATLGDGDFDFAISAQDSAGKKSDLLISTDPVAQPPSGWFLRWRK